MIVCSWMVAILMIDLVLRLGWAFGVDWRPFDTLWISATLGDVDSIQLY